MNDNEYKEFLTNLQASWNKLTQKQQNDAIKLVRKRFTRYGTYDESVQFIRKLPKFKSRREYINWVRDNNIKDVPTFPERVYPNEWVSWYSYLGIEKGAKK